VLRADGCRRSGGTPIYGKRIVIIHGKSMGYLEIENAFSVDNTRM
jgi:hypothetical protein